MGAIKPTLWEEFLNKIKTRIVSWGGHRLNCEGNLVMVKYVLSSLPIYQSSILLAPKSIMDQVSRLIQDFLWKGGKGNQDKFHLVSWDIVRRPLTDGGLQVRGPSVENVASRGKILWNFLSNCAHHVSKLLRKKILKMDHNLEHAS